MIFHVSIDALNPERTATILAQLMGGRATPFPPVAKGSWVAHGGDARNSLVEVYPRGTEIVEAPGDEDFLGLPGVGGPCAFHFAMGTALSPEEVFALAEREGLNAKYRKRGGAFGVIEFWLEEDRVVEVLTAEMQAEYLSTMTLANWCEMLVSGDEKHRVLA